MIIEKYPFQLGDQNLEFCHYGQSSSVLALRLHGDEKEASESGRWGAEQLGIDFLDILHPDRAICFRLNGGQFCFDPNRVFSQQGIALTLQDLSEGTDAEAVKLISNFADFITQFFSPYQAIIALHNNIDFNIEDYQPGGDYAAYTAKIFQNPSMDKHDLILVTQEKDFHRLSAEGVNVVLETQGTEDDGSLSTYCEKRNLRYFNIETYHGRLAEQKRLLTLVHALLNA